MPDQGTARPPGLADLVSPLARAAAVLLVGLGPRSAPAPSSFSTSVSALSQPAPSPTVQPSRVIVVHPTEATRQNSPTDPRREAPFIEHLHIDAFSTGDALGKLRSPFGALRRAEAAELERGQI